MRFRLPSSLRPPVGWLQLRREPARLAAASGGVGFAVLLVFMQLGFSNALFESSVSFHERFTADLTMISPRAEYLSSMKSFPRRRLYQALSIDGVAAVSSMYTGLASWKNPATGGARSIFVMGLDLADPMIDLPGLAEGRDRLQLQDFFAFDRLSRPEFGPIAAELDSGKPVITEVQDRSIHIAGAMTIGTSFGIDGTLIGSESNFRRIFASRPAGLIDIGLIRLAPGADAEAVGAAIRAALPPDVEVLTKRQLIDRELRYWADNTPIGFVFTFGSIVGLLVGAVIAYQILFTDISSHIPEYATLKAIGYRHRYLSQLVAQQAFIVALFGFVPGVLASWVLFRIAGRATNLPMNMTPTLALEIWLLALGMCSLSAMLALRKVRSADPAEIF